MQTQRIMKYSRFPSMNNPKTQREETMDVLESLSNTIYGAADDLRRLKKENAELKELVEELKSRITKLEAL